jgi:hypothetical protein
MISRKSAVGWSALALTLITLTAGAFAADPPKRVEFPATLKFSPDGLELLACKITRAHETVLMMPTVAPAELLKQIRLLGARPSSEWPGADEDFVEHWGDRLMLFIEWKDGDKVVRRRAEDLIFDVTEGRPVRRTGWVFHGKPGDEIEMPLTFKGLNPAAGMIASTYVVLPRAYLEDSYNPIAPIYRGNVELYPAKVASGEVTLPAKLIVEAAGEERLVQADIDAAGTEDERRFHRGLLDAARRIDAAKRRIWSELLPAHDGLEKKIVELSKKAGGESELEPLVWRGRAIQAEVRMLLKQCRRDLMEIELAGAARDLTALKSAGEKVKEIHDGDPVGWKERTIHEFKTYRQTAESERLGADRLRERHLRTAEWIAKSAEAPAGLDSADSVRRWLSDAVKAGKLPQESLTTFDVLRLEAAIADNNAEIGRAEIKLVRSQYRYRIEKGRNDEIEKRGMRLSDFAKEIVRRIQMYVDEATARQALCRARIAAAETHIRVHSAAPDARPALEQLLKEQQARVVVCAMKHAILAIDEEIDDLSFQLEKELGNPEAEAKIKKDIEERRARQKDLRARTAGKPGC